jgi:hypothetical protein
MIFNSVAYRNINNCLNDRLPYKVVDIFIKLLALTRKEKVKG